jgi:hypothetical protein
MDRPGIDGNSRRALARETGQIDGVRRRSLLRGGLLLGAATVGLTAASSITFAEEAHAYTPQIGWFWCKNCYVVFHSGNALNGGVCAATTFAHDLSESAVYQFDYNGGARTYSSQPRWTWCSKCQGLWFGPDIDNSMCPAGPLNHTVGSTTSYEVATQSVSHFQSGWNYCPYCTSLYHGSGHPAGYCQGRIGDSDVRHQPYPSTYWVAYG